MISKRSTSVISSLPSEPPPVIFAPNRLGLPSSGVVPRYIPLSPSEPRPHTHCSCIPESLIMHPTYAVSLNIDPRTAYRLQGWYAD